MGKLEFFRHKAMHLHQVNGQFVSEGIYNAERNTAKINSKNGKLRMIQQYYSDLIEAILYVNDGEE